MGEGGGIEIWGGGGGEDRKFYAHSENSAG